MIKRLIIATGGTGGHIYPAIAVADCVKDLHPETEILFVGTKRMEAGLIPKFGYPFSSIHIKGFDREISIKSIYKNFVNLCCLVLGISLFQAIRIIVKFKPDVILGAGGYPCGPVILAGYLMGIPGVIMEQNAVSGLTNRILSHIVKGAALGFDSSCKLFQKIKYCEVTGTPVRDSIIKALREDGLKFFNLDPKKKTILVFGGSLGSKNINLGFVGALKKIERNYPEIADKIQIIHSTGKRDYSLVIKESDGLKIDYQVFEFIDSMHLAYASSDLVIQRAGGVSIAEVACRGLPSIVIPWKGAAGDHQKMNADLLAQNDAAVVITDDVLTDEILAEKLINLMKNEARLKDLASNNEKFGRTDATLKIAILLQKVASLKK